MRVHVVQREGEVFGVFVPSLIFTIGNFQCAAASLLLGQFLELRGAWASASRAGLARGVTSRRSNAALLPHHCGQTYWPPAEGGSVLCFAQYFFVFLFLGIGPQSGGYGGPP